MNEWWRCEDLTLLYLLIRRQLTSCMHCGGFTEAVQRHLHSSLFRYMHLSCRQWRIQRSWAMSQSRAVINQLDRVLINHSSYKQREKKKNSTGSSTEGCSGHEGTNVNSAGTSTTSAAAQESTMSSYEEYRKSMGLPCNLINKKWTHIWIFLYTVYIWKWTDCFLLTDVKILLW